MALLRTHIVPLALILVACGGAAAEPVTPTDPVPPTAPSTPPPPPPPATDPTGGEAVSVVTSCTLPAVPPLTAFDLIENESYGSDPLQTFDVAKPKGAGPFPLVVVIHGGGWKGGDKNGLRAPLLKLTSLGYAAASLNYRLVVQGGTKMPLPVEDVRCAVRTLRERAAMYGIDPARIAAYGSSAGGHLAMMLGTASDAQGLDGSCAAKASASVSAVVTLAVPADMSTLAGYAAGQDEVTNAVGGNPDVDPAAKALGKLVSPIFHASAGDAPHLLVQGKSDNTVLPLQAPAMRDALRKVGVPVTLLELDTGHIAGGMLDDSGIQAGSCTALALLNAKLKPGP